MVITAGVYYEEGLYHGYLLIYPCRLPCDEVWGTHDVALCFLHDHNVSFIYIERDTDPNAEVYRFSFFFFC